MADANADGELVDLFEQCRTELGRLSKQPWDIGQLFRPLPLEKLDQIDRRLIVRSIFATIEAIAYRLKQIALESDTNGVLSNAERALCLEETYDISQAGVAETRTPRLRFLPNFRFAFSVAARVEGFAFHLDVSSTEWQALQRGVGIRDRVTHPKRTADLSISDDEMRDATNAYVWVEDQLTNWIKAALEEFKKKYATQIIAPRNSAV